MTVMFGVNDTGWSPGDEAAKAGKYTGGLAQYVDLAKSKNVPLLLLRETHFSHNKAGEPFVDNMNQILLKLFAAQDQLAKMHGVPVVDVYGGYTRELAKAWQFDPNYEFTPNVIHPTHLGHAAVAGELLKALGAGLPLAGQTRGPLHLDAQQPVELDARPAYGILRPDGKLEVKVRAQNLADHALSGTLLAVVGEQKWSWPVSLAAHGDAERTCEIAVDKLSQRWEVQPIYLALIGRDDTAGRDLFAAGETPLYYSHLLPTHDQPFRGSMSGEPKWVDWEGRQSVPATVSDLAAKVTADGLRVEFTWKDATTVLARNAPFQARLGAPVSTPLDMTQPFGQPCDAVELLLDPRPAECSARYTSNMDSIPVGTLRASLYKIEEGGKPVCKLQVLPEDQASKFKLSELGADRYAINWQGQPPASGVGFDMLVTDATEYAPNKTRGAWLTAVYGVGTDWVDFFRLSDSEQGVFYRVGY